MSTNSSIQWTDTTWNPVVGCTMVSPGCANCYAETMSNRLRGMAKADEIDGRNPGRNPLIIYEAKKRRDVVLRTWCNLDPDGTPIKGTL